MVQARSMDTCPSIVQDRAQFMALLKNIPPSFWLWFPEMMFEDMLRSTTWHLLMLRNWRCWSWTRGKRTWLAKAFVAHPWLLLSPLSTTTLSRCYSPWCLSNIIYFASIRNLSRKYSNRKLCFNSIPSCSLLLWALFSTVRLTVFFLTLCWYPQLSTLLYC